MSKPECVHGWQLTREQHCMIDHADAVCAYCRAIYCGPAGNITPGWPADGKVPSLAEHAEDAGL